MTRHTTSLLRRAYEHAVTGAGAIAVTVLLTLTVNAHAANPQRSAAPGVTPSVTILVPTVTIEAVE